MKTIFYINSRLASRSVTKLTVRVLLARWLDLLVIRITLIQFLKNRRLKIILSTRLVFFFARRMRKSLFDQWEKFKNFPIFLFFFLIQIRFKNFAKNSSMGNWETLKKFFGFRDMDDTEMIFFFFLFSSVPSLPASRIWNKTF